MPQLIGIIFIIMVIITVIEAIINFIANLFSKLYHFITTNFIEIIAIILAIVVFRSFLKKRELLFSEIKKVASPIEENIWLRIIELSANVGAFNRNLGVEEKKTINQWLTAKTESNATAKNYFHKHQNKLFNKAKGNRATIVSLCHSLNTIATPKLKEEALDLCYQVISVSGSIDNNQQELIEQISELLKTTPKTSDKLYERYAHYFSVDSKAGSNALLRLFGINPNQEQEALMKAISQQIFKLNNRVSIVKPNQKEVVKRQINQLVELKREYEKEDELTPIKARKQTPNSSKKVVASHQNIFLNTLKPFVIFIVIILLIALMYFLRKNEFSSVSKTHSYTQKTLSTNNTRNDNLNTCYYVKSPEANVRSHIPRTLDKSSVIGRIRKNTKVCPINQSYPASNSTLNKTTIWYRARFEKIGFGWVSSSVLSKRRIH